MGMRRALALLLVAACAPKEEFTPQIAIEPGALQRICFVCAQGQIGKSRCAPDVASRCSVLLSDVRGPAVALYDDDGEPEEDGESDASDAGR